MSDRFRNYPQPEDYIPNNYPRHCCKPPLEIMAGETTSHSFDVPFNLANECFNVEVIYQLGVEPVIIKGIPDIEIIVIENDNSIVTCKLSPEETILFKNTLLDTHVQLKFYLNDGSIVYSEIYKVFVNDALDLNLINRE